MKDRKVIEISSHRWNHLLPKHPVEPKPQIAVAWGIDALQQSSGEKSTDPFCFECVE